jgi:SNF2 family DNA or RNA helicase
MTEIKTFDGVRLGIQGQNTLVLRLGRSAATFSPIQRALSETGVASSTNWSKREIYASLSSLKTVYNALRDLPVLIEPDLQQEIDALYNGDRNVRRAKQIVARLSNPQAAYDELSDFPETRLLDAHQVQAVAAASHPEVSGLCLFDEQGLGKTISALFSFHRLRQKGIVSKMLVLCPKNMVLEWKQDIARFFGSIYTCRAVVGSEFDKRRELAAPADIYVTNFETPIRLQFRLRTLIEGEAGRVLLVVDESFYVKNTRALRSRAVRSLRKHVSRCLVLCGTPAPNRPHDLIEQFNIADNGVTFSGVQLPEQREAALPVVQYFLEQKGVYMRRLKRTVLPDLPGKTFQQVVVPLPPLQEAMYAECLDKLICRLEKCDDATFKENRVSFIGHRVRLLQICSNPVGVAADYSEVPAKLQALDSILEELIKRRREKVIVWCYFTASLEAIISRYTRYNPVRVDGKISDAYQRSEAVRRFQHDDDTMLFVANLAAASAGLTLHTARYAVYESLSNQPAHYFQSLDRIHRRGQVRPVEYIVLLCDRTIEANEYSRLLRKEKASQLLLGDETDRQITRQTLLEEAKEAAQILGLRV